MNNQEDFCDLYSKKICDNCGKCLEEEGVDIRAIKIQDISKKVEENEKLEAEYTSSLNDEDEIEELETATEIEPIITDEETLKEAYEKISKESGLDFTSLNDEEYEDAFDHIEYIEEYDLFDDANLEDLTVEVFPGVRRLKSEK